MGNLLFDFFSSLFSRVNNDPNNIWGFSPRPRAPSATPPSMPQPASEASSDTQVLHAADDLVARIFSPVDTRHRLCPNPRQSRPGRDGISKPSASALGKPRNRPPSPGAGLPAKGRHMSLPKHPLLIDLRPRLPQQRHELLLERPFPVMFCLSRDIIGDNLPAAPPGRAATAWARQTGRANCSRTHDNPVPAGTEYLSPVLQHWGTSQ